MRKRFSELLHDEMAKNSEIVLITGDLGYGLWDKIKIDFPDYGYLGFSHWAEDDKKIMSCFKNIKTYHPESEEELKKQFEKFLNDEGASYINLKRK